jgi:hypothetical protein
MNSRIGRRARGIDDSMTIKRELFIHALKMVEIDERTNIPSAVLFQDGGRVGIGYQAIDAADKTLVNENFKLNLGQVSPGRLNPPRFETGDGKPRSANEITQAFVERLVRQTQQWASDRGLKPANRILVAEPLALDSEREDAKNWLANYRSRLQSILQPFFEEVDFLPEPFAVFQYYRYGLKHPLVAGQSRKAALVVDFGGGTFDVSVVDTTLAGEVSGSGKNSRPLAASSVPVGGSLINLRIARQLLADTLEKGVDKNRISRGWETYRDGAASVGGVASLAADLQYFVGHVRRLIAEVETAKVHICGTIADWSLDATYDSRAAASIRVPCNPLSANPRMVDVRFDAFRLRDIFINRIWKTDLRPVVAHAIQRSHEELGGRPLDVVLLSGGSANIRWLSQLIEVDNRTALRGAEILELQEAFHEIVARGLAIECARRTYTADGEGDFKAVTYNRLCLMLGADGGAPRAVRYRPAGGSAPHESPEPGVLLQSAHVIGSSIDTPIRWWARLDSPPKRHLDYYFLKSSLDFNDLHSLYNVDNRVHTPPKTAFESGIEVELRVTETGHAYPRFIYRHAHGNQPEVSVAGTPFYLDMTSAAKASVGEAYVGLDFGTSNSSISYVERAAVDLFAQRAGEKGWMQLHELTNSLPYPVANPLAKFVAGRDEELKRTFPPAFETLLMMLAILAYADYGAHKGVKPTAYFKNFTKASAGPIWAWLRGIVDAGVKGGEFLPTIAGALDVGLRKQIDAAIAAINSEKHYREASADYHRCLCAVGNVLARALDGWRFGSFEAIAKRGFSHRFAGFFRVGEGAHAPFVHQLSYAGGEMFSEQEALLVHPERALALRLAPFLFWTSRDNRNENTIALLDSTMPDRTTYRTVEGGREEVVASGTALEELHAMTRALANSDSASPGARCEGIELSERNVDPTT